MTYVCSLSILSINVCLLGYLSPYDNVRFIFTTHNQFAWLKSNHSNWIRHEFYSQFHLNIERVLTCSILSVDSFSRRKMIFYNFCIKFWILLYTNHAIFGASTACEYFTEKFQFFFFFSFLL